MYIADLQSTLGWAQSFLCDILSSSHVNAFMLYSVDVYIHTYDLILHKVYSMYEPISAELYMLSLFAETASMDVY